MNAGLFPLKEEQGMAVGSALATLHASLSWGVCIGVDKAKGGVTKTREGKTPDVERRQTTAPCKETGGLRSSLWERPDGDFLFGFSPVQGAGPTSKTCATGSTKRCCLVPLLDRRACPERVAGAGSSRPSSLPGSYWDNSPPGCGW